MNRISISSLKYKDREKKNYLFSSHSKDTRKKDRHKLDFKTRHWVRFLQQENYLLTTLEEIFKGTLSGGCENPYLALKIRNKNFFFFKKPLNLSYYLVKQKDYLFSHLVWREKEELEFILAEQPRQFRKKWQEIKTKVEILSQWDNPARLVPGYQEQGRPKPTWEGLGWNSPFYWESKNRSLAALAFTHEIVLGKVDTPLIDLDPNKKDKDGNYKIKSKWLREALAESGKKWQSLINKYQIPYYWKTATPGNTCLPIPYWLIGIMAGQKIFHQDTGIPIGDLLGHGDLVALPVGSDKKRQLVITEWGKKLVKKHGPTGILSKELLAGDVGERVEGLLNKVFLTLDKKTSSLGRKKPISTTKSARQNRAKNKKREIEVSITAQPIKTPLLNLWKIFYRNNLSQKKDYFLVNDYQRPNILPQLDRGNTLNICLVQGYKHQFFSRVVG